MLNPMCQNCTWVKNEVTSCQSAPSATPGSNAPQPPIPSGSHSLVGDSQSSRSRSLPRPPVRSRRTKTTTLIPMRTCVTSASPTGRPPYAVRGWRTDLAPSRTHSGHWNPTDACRMQSGQIGRSHRWQRM